MSLRVESSAHDHLTVTFVLPAGDPPGAVSVVGSFNDWTPGAHTLERDDSGLRSVTVQLPYGRAVHFRYLAADGVWFDDPDADEITETGSVLHAVAAPAADVPKKARAPRRAAATKAAAKPAKSAAKTAAKPATKSPPRKARSKPPES
jgi:hypothetical protein